MDKLINEIESNIKTQNVIQALANAYDVRQSITEEKVSIAITKANCKNFTVDDVLYQHEVIHDASCRSLQEQIDIGFNNVQRLMGNPELAMEYFSEIVCPKMEKQRKVSRFLKKKYDTLLFFKDLVA